VCSSARAVRLWIEIGRTAAKLLVYGPVARALGQKTRAGQRSEPSPTGAAVSGPRLPRRKMQFHAEDCINSKQCSRRFPGHQQSFSHQATVTIVIESV